MEVTLLSVEECYFYAKIPPAGASGHRAQAWDVEQWTQEVQLKVIAKGDELSVSLYDKDSGELFAECPVPNEVPVQMSVEPVIDSSRYYVIKVVDRDSGHHAFIGIGFRERERSSDFMTAVTDHRQYLQRKARAEEMRQSYAQSEHGSRTDYRLKPGETITIRLPTKSSASASQHTKPQSDQIVLPPPPQDRANGDDEEWGDFVGT